MEPGDRLHLYGDRPDLAQNPPLFGQHLYGTQLTVDGSVLFHAEQLCATGTGPGFNTCNAGETEIAIPDLKPFSITGSLLISPNGRYRVFTPYNDGALWVDWFTGDQVEIDFHLQSVPNVSPPFSINQHAVSNDGRFLIGASGKPGLRIWSRDGDTVIPLPDYIEYAAISADGSTVVVTPHDNRDGPVSPTWIYDLASGNRTKLPGRASMSDDGKLVAYLSADPVLQPGVIAQALISRSDGSEARTLTNFPAGIRSLVLSGDGRLLFVVTGSPYSDTPSKLYRIDVPTAAAEEIPLPQ